MSHAPLNFRDHRIYLVHLLRVLRECGPSEPADIYDKVADRAGVTPEQREIESSSGSGNPVYRNRIQFARQSLIDAGLLISSADPGWSRGIWELNKTGRQIANRTRNDEELQKALMDLSSRGAKERKRVRDASRELAGLSIAEPEESSAQPNSDPVEEEVPTIKALVDDANEVVLGAMLESVRAMNDEAFEHLVGIVLKAALNADSVSVTRKSRDGGIDGLLSFDSLGMRIAVFEAKRYAADKSITRSQVDAFATVARRVKAAHSLFVTSSRFSPEAKEAAKNEGIRLIEGTVLIELMAKHGFGLRPRETYVVYEIDPTWSISANVGPG